MDKDASLDDFLDAGSDDDEPSEHTDSIEPADSGESVEGTADTEAASDPSETVEPTSDSAETTEPARSTGRWDPEGAVCDVCGATVTRRWREDDQFRCVECKSW